MSNQLAVIEEALNSKTTMRNLMLAFGAENSADAAAANEARRYVSSALAEIRRSAGAEFGDLTVCSPDSIVQAVTDAAKYRVEIDGRKLAHFESRWNKKRQCNEAILQIDTPGFVAKIAEAFPDVDYSTSTVFEGDDLTITEKDGNKDYELVRKNPFCSDVAKLLGVVVKISYTEKTGRFVQHVDTVSKTDLLAMQAMGKGTAWKNWPIERMRTAALKRCCKWHFKKLALLNDLIEYDNKNNYELTNGPAVPASAGTVIDNLNNELSKKKPAAKPIDADFTDVDDAPPAAETSAGPTPEGAPAAKPTLDLSPGRPADPLACAACKGRGSIRTGEGEAETIDPCAACGGTGKVKPDQTPPPAAAASNPNQEGKAA